MRQRICYGYISLLTDWASLKWPRWRPCKCFKFYGCLREREQSLIRDATDPQLHFVSYVWKSVHSRAVLVPGSITDEQMRPAMASCSQRLYRPWSQCSETGSLVWAQETVYTWTSALRRRTMHHKRQRRCRPPTTHTRLQRQLPPSFPGCPASHPRSGNQMLCVVQAHCVWPNVISRYLTLRNLILEREKKFRDSSSRSRLVSIVTISVNINIRFY